MNYSERKVFNINKILMVIVLGIFIFSLTTNTAAANEGTVEDLNIINNTIDEVKFSADINMQGTKISGEASGNFVKVTTKEGEEIGNTVVNVDGNYEVILSTIQLTGEELTIILSDDTSVIMMLKITAPIVDEVIVNPIDETKNPDNSNHLELVRPTPDPAIESNETINNEEIEVEIEQKEENNEVSNKNQLASPKVTEKQVNKPKKVEIKKVEPVATQMMTIVESLEPKKALAEKKVTVTPKKQPKISVNNVPDKLEEVSSPKKDNLSWIGQVVGLIVLFGAAILRVIFK